MAVNPANLPLRPTNLVDIGKLSWMIVDYPTAVDIQAPLPFSEIINRITKIICSSPCVQVLLLWT